MRADFGAKITAIENGLQFAMPVNFGFNDANVRPEDVAGLDALLGSRVEVLSGLEGHGRRIRRSGRIRSIQSSVVRATRDCGSDYLVSKGLTNNQLNTVGYGKTRLVTPGAWGDIPGAEQNRRVVFVIETRPVKSVALTPPATALHSKTTTAPATIK